MGGLPGGARTNAYTCRGTGDRVAAASCPHRRDRAGGDRVRVKLSVPVEQSPLGGGDAGPEVDDLPLRAHDSDAAADGADEVHLHLECRAGEADPERRENRCRHGGVEQGAGDAPVDRRERVVVVLGRLELEDCTARLELGQAVAEQPRRRRLRDPAILDPDEVIEAGDRCGIAATDLRIVPSHRPDAVSRGGVHPVPCTSRGGHVSTALRSGPTPTPALV